LQLRACGLICGKKITKGIWMFSFFEPRTCNDAMRELLLASSAGKPLSADQIGDAIVDCRNTRSLSAPASAEAAGVASNACSAEILRVWNAVANGGKFQSRAQVEKSMLPLFGACMGAGFRNWLEPVPGPYAELVWRAQDFTLQQERDEREKARDEREKARDISVQEMHRESIEQYKKDLEMVRSYLCRGKRAARDTEFCKGFVDALKGSQSVSR